MVADEVRNLAERSSKSAKEIGGLISDIQRGTEASVGSVEAGVEAVKQGLHVAADSRAVLDKIVFAVGSAGAEFEKIDLAIAEVQGASGETLSSVDSTVAAVEEATAATEQMAASSSQVLSSADAIANASERNAGAVEEVSASAEEISASIEEMANSAQSLAKMAQDLRSVVAAFKI